MKPLASSVSPTAYGARSACETRKSWPIAALPPTWVVIPSPASIARICGMRSVASGFDGGSGLIASRRTVEPRTYWARSASRPGGRWLGGQRVERRDLLGRQQRAGLRVVDGERALDPVDARERRRCVFA